MNGIAIAIEVGGPRGSRLAIVRVQGLVLGLPAMLDVGVVIERPQGMWEIETYEGGAGNAFASGLRFASFLEAVECAAKS
jgi:hypothetical protein